MSDIILPYMVLVTLFSGLDEEECHSSDISTFPRSKSTIDDLKGCEVT